MKRVPIKKFDLQFTSLNPRGVTDAIIIHHTGNPKDDDLSVQEIHESHQRVQGYSGAGYHLVLRKDGVVELGRPLWATGAHSYGDNWHTIGIHVCGNFEIAEVTEAQIESLALLIANLCADYKLAPHMAVKGHRVFLATACPGKNLYKLMSTIIGKALWYMQN